jgi:hypothetical protein
MPKFPVDADIRPAIAIRVRLGRFGRPGFRDGTRARSPFYDLKAAELLERRQVADICSEPAGRFQRRLPPLSIDDEPQAITEDRSKPK